MLTEVKSVGLSQEKLNELSSVSTDLIDSRTTDELLFIGAQLLIGSLLRLQEEHNLSTAREELYKIHHLMEAKLLKTAFKYKGEA